MINQVSTPLSDEALSAGDDLNDTLDHLWAQYLSLLDQYQNLRQLLAHDLSNVSPPFQKSFHLKVPLAELLATCQGHLDLAKANFSNANRVRYGSDLYDGRMQASTRIVCTDEQFFQVSRVPTTEPSSSPDTADDGHRSEVGRESSSQQRISANSSETEGPVNRPNDPLIWFGILRPPALKASQVAFQDAISKIPRLAALDLEMRGLEIEIRRTRKKLTKLEG